MTATAMRMAEDARYHNEMNYRMAKGLVTGNITSAVIRYAEMIVGIHDKEEGL